MYFQLGVAGDPTRSPGNSGYFFPLLRGLFVLCGLVLRWAAKEPVPEMTGRREASIGSSASTCW